MKKPSKLSISYLLIISAGILFVVLSGFLRQQETLVLGGLFWGAFLFGIWLFRPSSALHAHRMNHLSKLDILSILFTFLAISLTFTLPMSLSPHWNGSLESEVNEYEEMTHAILKGQIWLDIEVDPRLDALDNPYNVNERDAIDGLIYAWDHAYYNGHYYMYFGIVPVFLVFLPVYFLTGSIILSYQATQIIAVFTVLGLFSLFALLVKTFSPKLQISQFLFINVISSCVILWYPANAPALYCTATLSGVCLMIWSLFFFLKAVYVAKTENGQILCAFFGSCFGALVVGCRPPVAIANICVIPLLVVYLSSRKINPRLITKLFFAALPYVFIIGLLMLYNKARFDSFFEFGQSYQLTLEDQHEYADFLSAFQPSKYLKDLYISFLDIPSINDAFPYISYCGLLICFPVLSAVFALFSRPVFTQLQIKNLTAFVLSLFITPLIIILMDGLWSPFLLERYKLDYDYIICLLFCLSILFCSSKLSPSGENRLSFVLYLCTSASIFIACLLFLVPIDYNYTFYFGDRALDLADSVLFFWHYL